MSDGASHIDNERILDALPRAVIVSDPAGTIFLWNAAAEELFGWSAAEAKGRSVVELLAPADKLPRYGELLERVAGGDRAEGDRVVIRRDGSQIRVSSASRPVRDATGAVIAIVSISVDVTERRRVEQNASELGEHFELALDAGGLGTWRWDLGSGHTTWDERLEAIFGLPAGGFDGTYETYVSLLHPDDREQVLQAVADAVEAKSAYQVAHRILWPDGSIRWMEGGGAVTVDEHGTVTGTIGCAADITQRVEQDLERDRLSEMAVAAAELERVQRERLQFIADINDALNSSDTTADIMERVSATAVPRLGDWCAIHLLVQKSGSTPEVEIAHVDPSMVAYARSLRDRFPYDPDALAGVPNVIRTGTTEFHSEIDDSLLVELDLTPDEREVVNQLALRSSITVALKKRGRVFGAMQFVMSSSSRRYTLDDVALAEAVAGRIAASLENRRLNAQQHRIAHTLQRSLLPASLPEIPNLEIAVRYWAAGEGTEVGGDFYDVFRIDDERWAIVIGDVCGTGPEAAALTGLARHSIRDSAWHGDTPTEVLASLNRAILRSDTASFCTAAFATLGPGEHGFDLTLSCGGHPLPIHVHHAHAQALGRYGTLLGMLSRTNFTSTTTTLEAGDVLVFYTDGATDLPPPHGLTSEQLGILIERSVGGSADSVADKIHGQLEALRPFTDRDDDLALLIIRVR